MSAIIASLRLQQIDMKRFAIAQTAPLSQLEIDQLPNLPQIPDEVWKSTIIPFYLRDKQSSSDIELALRLFSCVTKSWSVLVVDLIRYYFSLDIFFSPWI